jgi:hypothetical protein
LNEQGSVLIIVAVSFVVLLGLVALVVDIGLLYSQRESLVRAVTAAALAGVQKLPDDPDLAETVGLEYARLNGIEAQDELTAEATDEEIGVRTRRKVPMQFAQVFGLKTLPVSASAKARVGAVKRISGAVPFGVVKQNFVFGQEYTLKFGSESSENVYSGNFGALALGGTGASNYRKNICEGCGLSLEVGDWVPTETGNMNGPTKQGVDERVRGCMHVPSCTYDNFVPGCPRFAIVPVIDSLEVNGRGEVKIVGFAAFFITGARGGEVTGYFLRWSADADLGSGEDYGLLAYRLVSVK